MADQQTSASSSAESWRYGAVAVVLHWLIAALLLFQIYVGWTFGDMARGPARDGWFSLHKTIGILILLLSLIRLAWRLGHKPAPYPTGMPRWERVLAGASHVLFYVIMIGLPLTGWAAISSGGAAMRGDTATTLIGGVPLPFIPGLPRASHEWFEGGHGVLVKVTYVLLVLHVGGALKHQLFDKRGRAFVRMWPFGAR